MHTDSELMARVRAGSQRAFAELIDRYKARVFHTALRMLGNREDAEEAAQDTFLRAYRGLENFREEASFSTWIYRICVNTCLNLLESRRRFKAQQIERMPAIALPAVGSPELDFEDSDLQARVVATVEKLPEKYRTVLILYHIQHLTYREIADILDVPMNSVKTLLFRARAMLRERLLRTIPNKELVV